MKTNALKIALTAGACALAVTAAIALQPSAPASAAAPVVGAANAPFPTISVKGVAELRLAPDRAELTLSVEAFDPRIDKAQAETRRRTTAVLAALKKAGVADADIAMRAIQVREWTRVVNRDDREQGFRATRTIAVTVHDLKSLDALLTSVVSAGATGIDRVVFTHSKLDAHKAKARLAAVKAAKAKAKAMARELGQDIGPAIRINEDAPGTNGGHFAMVTNPTYSNMVLEGGGQPTFSGTIASGEVVVKMTVWADFALR